MRRNLPPCRSSHIVVAASIVIGAAASPVAAAPIALTSENVAFGGEELESAVTPPGGGEYRGLQAGHPGGKSGGPSAAASWNVWNTTSGTSVTKLVDSTRVPRG